MWCWSSMWLTRCSTPDSTAVVPATPVATPRSASALVSCATASGSAVRTPEDQEAMSAPTSSSSRIGPSWTPGSVPTNPARVQSAGATNIEVISPKPGAVHRRRRLRDRLGVGHDGVRPARGHRALHAVAQHHRHVVGVSVDRGRGLHGHQDRRGVLTDRGAATLAMSLMVPPPTATTASTPRTAALAVSRTSSTTWSSECPSSSTVRRTSNRSSSCLLDRSLRSSPRRVMARLVDQQRHARPATALGHRRRQEPRHGVGDRVPPPRRRARGRAARRARAAPRYPRAAAGWAGPELAWASLVSPLVGTASSVRGARAECERYIRARLARSVRTAMMMAAPITTGCRFGRDVEQRHAVVEDADDQQPDEGVEHAAGAAGEARAADDDDRDDVEQVGGAGRRLGRVEPRARPRSRPVPRGTRPRRRRRS